MASAAVEVDKVRQGRGGLIVADGAQAIRYVYEELGGLYAERRVAPNWPSAQMTVIFQGVLACDRSGAAHPRVCGRNGATGGTRHQMPASIAC